jgi:hypothetical protein
LKVNYCDIPFKEKNVRKIGASMLIKEKNVRKIGASMLMAMDGVVENHHLWTVQLRKLPD